MTTGSRQLPVRRHGSQEVIDRGLERGVFPAELFDVSNGVENGAVVSAAEESADFFEAHGGELSCEEHTDLSRQGDRFGSAPALDFGDLDAEVGAYGFDDGGWAGGFTAVLLGDVSEGRQRKRSIDFSVALATEQVEFGDDSFEFPGVGLDPRSDQVDHVPGEINAADPGLLFDDGHSRFQARLVDPGDQTPVEAADESLFEGGDFAGRRVGCQNDLFLFLIERVERVEEFFLSAFVPGEELDVVHYKYIDVAIAVAEVVQSAALDRLDEMIGKVFAGKIEDFGGLMPVVNRMAHRLKQVRLSQTHIAVDKQGVV